MVRTKLALVLVMVVGVFGSAACASSTSEEPEDAASTEEEAQPAEAPKVEADRTAPKMELGKLFPMSNAASN